MQECPYFLSKQKLFHNKHKILQLHCRPPRGKRSEFWFLQLLQVTGQWELLSTHGQSQLLSNAANCCLFCSLSLVFVFCYQQVHVIFNMSCLGWYSRWGAVMAHLHRRMVRLHTHTLTYHVLAGVVSSSWMSFSDGGSSLTAEAFLWPHC